MFTNIKNEDNYRQHKESLNKATGEIRNSPKQFGNELAKNIKNYSKSFYAYSGSEQNV